MTNTIKFINENSGVLSLLFSFVVAGATVFYAILTRRLVDETRRMRAIQSDPHIAVWIESHEASLNFIMLVIENIGFGPAYDIHLSADPDFEADHGHHLSQIGIFEHGIPFMAPGQKITFYLTSLLGQIDEIQKPHTKFRFTVTAKYKSATNGESEQQYRIDFLHLLGLSTLGDPPLQSIADNIEKIKDSLERIQSGSSRLKVDFYSTEDRK
jgi:hypothetical protein